MANQNAIGPPPHSARDSPYKMPYEWNTEALANEEQEQQNAINNDEASSHAQKNVGAQHQEYIEGDEEALETSFQALEIVGTTSTETKGGDPRPSRVIVMGTKVLISNGFQPSKGLGKKLDGMTEPVALQENLGRSSLGYMGTVKKERPRRKTQSTQWIQLSLYCHFTSGGIISLDQIAVIGDQLLKLTEWIDNVILTPDNANKSNRQDEGEGPEEEALI
ncbi:hypothetical protein CR513_33639, partial [Mucuna pruriens]